MGVSGLSERGRITQTHGWDRGDQTVLSLLYSPPELGLAALSLPPSPTPFSFQAGSGEGRGEGKKKKLNAGAGTPPWEMLKGQAALSSIVTRFRGFALLREHGPWGHPCNG